MIKITSTPQLTEKEQSFLLESRALIDQEHKEIMRHIAKRVILAKSVMQYKKKKGWPIFDGKREQQLRDEMVKFAVAEKLKLDKKTIIKIVDFLLAISKEEMN